MIRATPPVQIRIVDCHRFPEPERTLIARADRDGDDEAFRAILERVAGPWPPRPAPVDQRVTQIVILPPDPAVGDEPDDARRVTAASRR